MGLLLAAVAPGQSQGQELLRAAAVVNDEVISMLDLDMRIRLAILATGQRESPELRQRIAAQVMRGLIDERLQAQEATRLDIEITDEQVDGAIDQLAERNNMNRDDFLAALEGQGVLKEALLDQIRGQLVWRSLIARRLRPSVQVSEEEVQEIVNRITANRGSIQWRVAEIFLAVDSVLQEDEVRANAERLMDQLRAGAKFTDLARQFSQSATAAAGGDIGWVQEGQLAPEIDAALAAMQDKTTAGPVRTLSGFHILLLREQRTAAISDVSLHLKQVLFPLAADATDAQRQEMGSQAAAVRERIAGCDGMEQAAADSGAPGADDLGTVKLADLPPDIQGIVRSLPIGTASEPTPVSAGITVLVVCERTDAGIDLATIREQLTNEQLDLQARRYMRDLRRVANVDIRI
jgi:peptidyl-prolyl cis-trans isomerase SurA